MALEQEGRQDAKPSTEPIIETAAGTTSPDNANSGKFAYVITILTLVLLVMVGTSLSSCVQLMAEVAISDLSDAPLSELYGVPDDDGHIDYYEEFGDIYDQDFENFDFDLNLPDDLDLDGLDDTGGEGSPVAPTAGSVRVKDALASELTMYSATIDVLLPARDYANSEQSVHGFVRDLVLLDRDASSEMADSLRHASWGSADLGQSLASSTERAQDMAQRLRGMELPTLDGDHAPEVTSLLERGREHAAARWDAISAELALLSAADEVDGEALNRAEVEVMEEGFAAAESLSQALSASARR